MFLPKKFERIKEHLYWFIRGPYQPESFWHTWGKTFADEPMQQKIYPQHHWLIDKLVELRPKSLLEIGCGFGRNIKFILEFYPTPISITGCDLSSTMLDRAKIFLHQYLRRVNLDVADVRNLPYRNQSFDLILCHGVLMHLLPTDIDTAIGQLVRTTRKHLIIIEQNDKPTPLKKRTIAKINYYTYSYPYKTLLEKYGCEIVEHHRHSLLDWYVVKVNHAKSIL